MFIDYDKYETEDAEAQSSWGRELVTAHSTSLGTGGDKYNGSGFGSLIIDLLAGLLNYLLCRGVSYWLIACYYRPLSSGLTDNVHIHFSLLPISSGRFRTGRPFESVGGRESRPQAAFHSVPVALVRPSRLR